MRQLKND